MRMRERDLVFDEFCRIAVTRGGFVLARIVEVDAAGLARVAATTEDDPALFQAMVDAYNADPAGAGSLLAVALRSGDAVVSNDIASDPRVANREALARGGSYALALLPIAVEGARRRSRCCVHASRASSTRRSWRCSRRWCPTWRSRWSWSPSRTASPTWRSTTPLTGLPNRTLFHERLTQAHRGGAARARPEARARAVRPRALQGDQRHARPAGAGDEVLKERRGRGCAQPAGDVNRVARLGGNLFAVMFHGDRATPRRSAARLEAAPTRFFGAPVRGRRARAAPHREGGHRAVSRTTAPTPTRCCATPRRAQARQGDRRALRCSTRPQINARVAEQVELEHRCARRSSNGELFLHFQPKVDLATRQHRPARGADCAGTVPTAMPISPAKFVPVLEQTGLILRGGPAGARRGGGRAPATGRRGARTRRASRSTSRRCSCAGAASSRTSPRRSAACSTAAAASTSRSPRAC